MPDSPMKAEHDARVKALNEANVASAKAQAMPPTPSQEENDLMRIGEMHIDDKASGEPQDKRPAPPAAEQHERRPAPEPARTRS